MPTGASSPTVLVVDEERVRADSFADILNRFGFQSVSAYGTEHALSLASRFVPDVLMTDLGLQPMTCMNLAHDIVALHPRCKVLFLTGFLHTREAVESVIACGESFSILAKPAHPMVVIEAVRQLTSRRPHSASCLHLVKKPMSPMISKQAKDVKSVPAARVAPVAMLKKTNRL